MPKREKKFRTKLFKIFILISLVPLIIISYDSLSVTIRTREKNIAELQALAIENTSDKVKKFLDQKMEVFNLIVSGEADDIKEIDAANLNHLIESLKESAGDVEEISFASRNGQELVKLSQDPRLLNISDSPEFITAAAGQNYFSGVVYTDKGPEMRMASRIENKNRQIIGVIAATIDLNPVQGILEKIKLGSTGFVYLVDDAGRLIASSNNYAPAGEPLLGAPLVKDTVAGNLHDGLASEDQYTDRLGQKVIFAGRPMGKVNWFVISEWPRDDAYSVINEILLRSAIIIASSLVLILILAFVFARQVVKPIEILKEGAKQITGGNLDYCLDLETNDEFAALGERFNEMIKALKENKKLKDEFVFIAAHELRAPVTAIKGYLSMVLDGSFGRIPAAAEKNLKIVEGANERLVQLVQDLLEVARNESGTLKVSLSPLKISESIQTVIKELSPMAGQKGLKIVYKDPFEKNVQADAFKLKEVLVNLVTNAIKYTPTSGEILISHEIKGKELLTSVKDSGIGIAPEDMGKLFNKFYRVKTEETAKIEGTGLGLFISKEIVERMGGRIEVESQPGKGSTFSFSLLIS